MTEEGIFAPVQIRPYIEVLGERDAVAFLLEFGGAELYLSRNPRRSRVAKRFGAQKAALLAERAEHLPARVPLARKWCAQVLYKENLPISEIARNIKQMGRPSDPRQPDLFTFKS